MTVRRRTANYQPTAWSHSFVQSIKTDTADAFQAKRIDALEEEIRAAMNDDKAEPFAILLLIDDVQRMGLGYRFEEDIERALYRYVCRGECIGSKDRTLFTTSLAFRLLRQHGFEVSQDVFKSFTDESGKFLNNLEDDIKGILGLYEASYMAFEGELILEEAKTFSTKHLRHFINLGNIKTGLDDQVKHSLELPLHWRMQWQEGRWYIDTYSKRKNIIHGLLELAVLNFNTVQQILQEDLQYTSRWWNEISLANKLPFARDRLMECFVWTVGMAYEPRFSNCRKGLTKVTSLITIIDDVYDVYGTLDELELFTDAVERWDVKVVDNLPQYMKVCYLALYNTVREMAYYALKEHGQNIIPYLTKPAELEMGETASSITCYMLEKGASEEVAREHINKFIVLAWNKMNKQHQVCNSMFGKSFIQMAFNLARISHCTCHDGDSHGAPDIRSKKRVHSLLIEPITITGKRNSNKGSHERKVQVFSEDHRVKCFSEAGISHL
ncbi:probable terpene synthase 12 isoform X2 [Punica granatum]|uniref:Uncharacterized protein n=2 Tax=Punica granatum TaxID=22663 RepID=A0A2I0IQZ2_PUNGR|nr:probable terpene synthase 12 isoform X2 [Punica granatum]PKI46417.1 hypothetical protein CRG98_033193 [Punica granatum]